MKILYCLHCKKIKEEGSDKWVVSKTPLCVLAGMKGITMEGDYCDGCGAIIDGVEREQKLAQRCKCLGQGNFD